ncbi:hypothetical protein PR003_g7697 [Phytophthora rubi]|uniref:Pectate lyase n=1 Tax=Phytophthora rubi TaxID=129364 RepID=A0A6A3NAF5_9STRA|nr:hypothetical protein PR002_g7473 [Phytophthora rubi]KAE9040359.1 hypothetical protein PR001_g7103 [Phytophthora rubi]KAE9345904.1 hypothetical protein PR003_g7697 [Phytophthora rubi]
MHTWRRRSNACSHLAALPVWIVVKSSGIELSIVNTGLESSRSATYTLGSCKSDTASDSSNSKS